jgi:2'-5' RNA ligase
MAEHIRLFFALPVPAPRPAQQLIERLERFKPTVKPVDPAHLHLTLRFIGPAPEQRVTELSRALDEAVAAAAPGVLRWPWEPPAFFPQTARKPPRTIVLHPAGLSQDSPIHHLEQALSQRLAGLEPPIPPEGRPYQPHLTLARLKQPKGKGRMPMEELESELGRFAATDFGEARITTAHLFQSVLTPQGPQYTSRHAVELG